MIAWGFGFWMWRQTLATRRPVPVVGRILCSNAQGLAGNLSALTVVSSRYDILLCSETLVPDMRHVSELLVPGFGRPVFCRSKTPRARGMAANIQDVYRAFANPNLSVVVSKCWSLGFVVWVKTLCVHSLSQPRPRLVFLLKDLPPDTTTPHCCASYPCWTHPSLNSTTPLCQCPLLGRFNPPPLFSTASPRLPVCYGAK